MEKLSVCVPAYNAAGTLEATLRSVLEQDCDFELVVLNNASADRTEEIARSFDDPRLRIFRNDALLAIGDNWNKVIGLSSGALVKVLCADDLLRPGSIAAQLDVMASEGISLSSSRYELIDEGGTVLQEALGIPGLAGVHPASAAVRAIIRRGPEGFAPTAAVMFRRAHFDRVGGFRGDLVWPMDVDLFARVAVFGDFCGLPGSAVAYRVSTTNLSNQTSTLSKLTESARHHHRIARDCPTIVRRSDLLVGDFRLVRTAFRRLGVRARLTVSRLRSP